MHNQRAMALLGAVVGVIGLFVKAVTSDAEGLMPSLAQAVPDFPDGLPTIWGGLDTWAQVVLVVLIAVVVVLALRPPRREPMDKTSGIALTIIGVALFAYAVVKWLDAADSATTLTDSFAQLAEAGVVPAAFTAGANPIGFVLLLAGTLVVAATGIQVAMGRTEELGSN